LPYQNTYATIAGKNYNLIGSITLEELINLSVLKNDINNNVQQNEVKYAK